MKRLWLLLASGLMTAAACGAPDTPTAPGTGDSSVELPASAVAQIESLLAEKAARTPAQRKIASSLLYASSGRFVSNMAMLGQATDPARQHQTLYQVAGRGRYLIDIKAEMSAIAGRVEALGGSYVHLTSKTARVWLPIDQVETLAAETAVKAIRPAFQAQTWRTDSPDNTKAHARTRASRVAAVQAAQNQWAVSVPTATAEKGEPPAPPPGGVATNAGAATSEGDKAEAGDRARKFFGTDGAGVKVGVLSDSDDHLEASIATGDLPANTTTVPGENGRPGSGEGTAMMEIVHDVAPGADLFFATAFTSPESFAANIRTLRFTYHCDVIIDDVIYFFESPYEDDIIAQAVEDVIADGAMYFSSAGNGGNFDDGTSGTWEGDFKPAGTLATLPSGYTVHSFGNGVIENRVELDGGPLILHWADPGTLDNPASGNDYDLFVLDNDLRNVAVASTDVQDGTGLPFEFLGFIIPAGFRVVVAAHPTAEVRALRTVVFGGEFALSTNGSTYGHNSTANGFGVAAVDAAEADGGEFVGGRTTPIEIFSSDGPRRVFFDRDNTPINADHPGQTFASHGGNVRAKPDLSAADGVHTTLPAGSGLNPFFGTSAAAPHAGAIAALVKSALPAITQAKLRTALLSGSIDIEQDGTDRNSGRGIVSAFNALTKAGAKAAVSLVSTNVAITPLGSDVVLPGGAAQVSITVSNVGGANATAVTATLTSSSPNVLILQGSSAYPALPVDASGTNIVPFAFFVNPASPCGATLPFTLTLNYTGNGKHPVTLSFSVPTGRPSTTASHFAFTGAPIAIPDDDPAGINASIDVAGFSGAISSVGFNIDGTVCNANIGSTTVGVDHTFVADLTFTLSSPSGRQIVLISGAGGSGNNFCQTLLRDTAATSIQSILSTQAPFTGTFKPNQPLAKFIGDTANGSWTLNVADNAGVDVGSVRAVSLDISGFSCSATP
jgi:subtilisin-like proprotein convertase family protein